MYILHLLETIHLVGVQWKIAGKNREPQTQKCSSDQKNKQESKLSKKYTKTIRAIKKTLHLQQQQRPDLSRLMQLQAAGAGLPTSIAAGLPPGFLQPNNAAAAAAAAAGLPGIPPGFLTGGLPPASIAAQMAAAGIRPPALPPVSTSSAAELALRASREEEAAKLALSMLMHY